MTPHEKATETRRRNKEAQRQHELNQRKERELIRQSLQAVLENPEATPAEKLESSKLLLDMNAGKYWRV